MPITLVESIYQIGEGDFPDAAAVPFFFSIKLPLVC